MGSGSARSILWISARQANVLLSLNPDDGGIAAQPPSAVRRDRHRPFRADESPRKCEVLIEANARVVGRLLPMARSGAARSKPRICRLVAGIAVVADLGKLDPPGRSTLLAIVADGLLT